VRRHGFVCGYTGIALDLDNPKSPWYFEFDHETPGDKSKVVLTCALINEMKSDRTKEEFKYYVCQLAKCFTTGAKIRKRKLKYWYRLENE
jgi:hypothetical protein